MLMTFHSGASADVIMFGDDAKRLLTVIGKDPDAREGIVTGVQLGDAIERLQAAIAEARAQAAPAGDEDEQPPEKRGMGAPVGLVQRAFPLLQMLQEARRAECPVTWSV